MSASSAATRCSRVFLIPEIILLPPRGVKDVTNPDIRPADYKQDSIGMAFVAKKKLPIFFFRFFVPMRNRATQRILL
jgi:hypothetical protein